MDNATGDTVLAKIIDFLTMAKPCHAAYLYEFVTSLSVQVTGADIHSVRVNRADLLEYLPTALYYSEGFAINGQLVAKYLLNQAIHKAGYKVVLSGEGASSRRYYQKELAAEGAYRVKKWG